MEARAATGVGTRTEMKAVGRESLGTFEVVKEVGRRTRVRRRRQRITNNHSRNTRGLSETVASCGKLEPRDDWRETGSGTVVGDEEVQDTRKELQT